MSNLTISTDRDVLKKARLRAVREGTSVNAVLRNFMESYAGVHGERVDAVHDLLELAKSTRSRSGGQRWSRDEVHERG
jgi:plasmid stability protein